MILESILFILVCARFVQSENTTEIQPLPSFLKICHRKDPHLNRCIKESVEQLRPLLITGIPEFDIPSIEPLVIPEMVIDQGSGAISIKSTYTDIKVYGPSKFKLRSVKIDLEKDRVRIKLHLPYLHVVSEYEINGKIMMMPILGKGKSYGNYSDIDTTVTMQSERINKNGKTHFHIKEFYVDFILGQANIKLDNLFNGDKQLGEAMNTFLNENWKQVTNEIKPVLEDTIAAIFKKFANKIFHKYSIDVILPE